MTLAYTSSGVEDVTVIDQEKLNDLARWLCQEKEYHYPIEKMREAGRTPNTRAEDARFDREVKENGGYCHICKDFAGEILSHFDIAPKVSA